jgi:hypothetical protein
MAVYLIAGLVVVVVLLVVLSKMVKARSTRWERVAVDKDQWKIINRTGIAAHDVRLEVRGEHIRGIDTGEVGDLAPGAEVEFRTADTPDSTGGSPMVIVTWQVKDSSRRHMWAAPLNQ